MQAEQQETELARQAARQATDRGKQILLYSLAAGLALVLVFLLVMRARRKRLQGVEQENQQIAEELGQAQGPSVRRLRARTVARRPRRTSWLRASPRRESGLP